VVAQNVGQVPRQAGEEAQAGQLLHRAGRHGSGGHPHRRRPGRSHVRVLDGTRLNQELANGEIAPGAALLDFFAFPVSFTGGATVGARVAGPAR